MGKAGYKKFLKKERAKVKLKGSKTLLPKGQNVTDTNFKVKKIVIKDQIKQHQPGEVLSKKKKLSVKELVSRLSHHNTSMKIEALSGLSEIISMSPNNILEYNLAEVIHGVSKLTVDTVPDARKEACKLLKFIFSQMSVERLSPVFPSVFSYLKCGLTHIDRGVRGDSLTLLDSLLDSAPAECSNHSSDLLPICLDLVSETASGSRSLSLNLDSRLTAEKWRGKVLARIRTLLSTLANLSREQQNPGNEAKREIKCDGVNGIVSISTCPNSYTNLYRNVFALGLNKFEEIEKNDRLKFDIKAFCTALIPVLIDTFIEVVPVEDETPSMENSSGRTVDMTAIAMLQCISDIILSLWAIVVDGAEAKGNAVWMRENFADAIMNRLVSTNFPYGAHSAADKKGKKKKECDMVLSVFKADHCEPECYSLNISLSKLIVLFAHKSQWKPAIGYMKNCLRVCGKLGPTESETLASCILEICQKCDGPDARSVLSIASSVCTTSSCPLVDHLFKSLVTIAASQKFVHFHSEKNYEQWLCSLPEALTKPSISKEYLEAILLISKKRFPSFSLQLDGFIEAILDNIPRIRVEGMDRIEAELNISNLLYWVEDWDEELLDSLKKGVENGYWGDSISQHIKEIVATKAMYGENTSLNRLMETDDWWTKHDLASCYQTSQTEITV